MALKFGEVNRLKEVLLMILSPLEAFNTAVAVERAAWEKVQGHLPGNETYDPVLWQAWKEAVAAADAARKELTEHLRPSSSSGSGNNVEQAHEDKEEFDSDPNHR